MRWYTALGDIKAFLSELFRGRRGKLAAVLLAGGVIVLLLCSSFPAGSTAPEGQTLGEYKEELESSLAEFCSSVSGAGRCRVMVSFEAGESLEYKGGNLVGTTPPRVEGITVLCKGGDRDSVKSEISDLLSALYGIGKNRICVLKLSA